ncbi:MAG: hypothetical protein V3V47_06010 [Desulfobacteria bacterium]
MAYRLFQALNRAASAFTGAPDPEEVRKRISPQMQKNLDRRAARVRFQGFRRMQGRPGVRGPFGFTAGRTAPISPQAAAQFVSGKLGTQYAPELNRLTAPEPQAFARGARAPELADIDVRTGIAGARLGEAGAGTLEAKLPYVPRREEAEIGGLTSATARAEAETAGRPTPEELAKDRGLATSLAETQLEQAKREDHLAAMADDIASLEEQGYIDEAQQIRVQRDALLGGAPAPDRTPPGGAPPIVSPVRLAREQEGDAAVMQRYGFTEDWLKGIRGGFFGTGAFKLGYGQTNTKLEQLINAIKTAPPEYAEAIIRQVRPLLSRLEILKRGPRSPMAAERKAAALVTELEDLIAFDNTGAMGGAPPVR